MVASRLLPRLPADAVERRGFVDAPPEIVWASLHDPDRTTARGATIVAGPAGPDWPAAGASRPARLRLGPVALGATVESLEARPGRRFRVGIDGRAVRGERRWELSPAAGGTRVASAIHLEARGPVAGLLLRLERRGMAARLEAELASLKEHAEAAAASPGRPGSTG